MTGGLRLPTEASIKEKSRVNGQGIQMARL